MNVIDCYILHNPTVEYCQELSLIAGFFYLFYNNEEIAFAMLASMIRSMNISGFYQKNTFLIMKYIYKINRLIAAYFPALHTNFYESGINVIQFASSWFTTAYCYVLQYETNIELPPLLIAFFDKFLIVLYINKNRMALLCSLKQLYLF